MRPPTLQITDEDLHLFNEGSHLRLYEKLRAHRIRIDSCQGTLFAVWAPDAARVSVIGNLNDWSPAQDDLAARARSGSPP
jgi:1,4-alpha-glucan branching enzyme